MESESNQTGVNIDNIDPSIMIIVVDTDGEEINFKIKRKTKMKRVFEAFCRCQHYDINLMRL